MPRAFCGSSSTLQAIKLTLNDFFQRHALTFAGMKLAQTLLDKVHIFEVIETLANGLDHVMSCCVWSAGPSPAGGWTHLRAVARIRVSYALLQKFDEQSQSAKRDASIAFMAC